MNKRVKGWNGILRGEDEVGQGVPARLFCPALGLAPKTVADTTRSDEGGRHVSQCGQLELAWHGPTRKGKRKGRSGTVEEGEEGLELPFPVTVAWALGSSVINEKYRPLTIQEEII